MHLPHDIFKRETGSPYATVAVVGPGKILAPLQHLQLSDSHCREASWSVPPWHVPCKKRQRGVLTLQNTRMPFTPRVHCTTHNNFVIHPQNMFLIFRNENNYNTRIPVLTVTECSTMNPSPALCHYIYLARLASLIVVCVVIVATVENMFEKLRESVNNNTY